MIDSLMGTPTAERSEKVMTEGYSGRDFPSGALSWSDYFKFVAGNVVGWPVVWLFINHIKDKPATIQGLPSTKTTPGGSAQRYHASIFFHVKRLGQGTERATWEVGGERKKLTMNIRRLRIFVDKTSIGASDGRKIEVDFCWWHDKENEQHSFFDWDGATARLLAAEQKRTGWNPDMEGSYSMLSDLLPVTVNSNLYSCRPLGMSGVQAHTLGAAIRSDPELTLSLAKFFHINHRPVWGGEMLEDPLEHPPGEPKMNIPESKD
jgi:hypothetical protein